MSFFIINFMSLRGGLVVDVNVETQPDEAIFCCHVTARNEAVSHCEEIASPYRARNDMVQKGRLLRGARWLRRKRRNLAPLAMTFWLRRRADKIERVQCVFVSRMDG